MKLELISEKHISELYQLADKNREHLRPWFPWISMMHSVDFFVRFVNMTKQKIEEGVEKSYVIYKNEVLVGRIGIYKIDKFNSNAEIGYWIDKEFEGQGIVSDACREIIRIAFNECALHRIEIRCAETNIRSQMIPEKLGFKFEGILMDAERVNDKYNNLKIYSFINNKM